MPVNKPAGPRSRAILRRRLVIDSPGRPLVLLIFDKRVSAGCEMIAAAKPAMRPKFKHEYLLDGIQSLYNLPEPKFSAESVPGDISDLGLPLACTAFSKTTS